MKNYQDIAEELYYNFVSRYSYISVDENVVASFVRTMGVQIDANDERTLDLLQDYILSNDLADEIEL